LSLPLRPIVLAAAAALALAGPSTVVAQLSAPTSKAAVGARMPALSPDGKRLAFVYRGDIWIAESSGGRAAPLTRNVEMEGYPMFSPDGSWVAFASLRGGNWDMYAVPAAGGEVKRLTWNSGDDIAYGWSPDGKNLIFSGRRDTNDGMVFTLDVNTLRLRKLAQDYRAMAYPSYSPDGKTVVMGYRGLFHWSRPRYNGSGAHQLALLDPATGKRTELTNDGKQHLWPKFLPDGKTIATVTYGDVTPNAWKLDQKPEKYIDSPERTPNIWFFDTSGKGRQVTRFTGGAVRWPAVAAKSGDVAFEYGSDLYLLKAGQKEPAKLALIAAEDEAQSTFRHEVLTGGATEAEPSPDGKTFAFGLRGEIWTVPVERAKGVAGRSQDQAKRITNWVGSDFDFIFSPDSKKLLYRSDRDYVTRLYEVDLATQTAKSLWTRSEDVGQLRLSPDGKEIAFWIRGAQGGLYIHDIATGVARRALAVPDAKRAWQEGGDFTWSPDGKWYAFTVSELQGGTNVWVVPSAGGEPINVTRLNAGHGNVAWTPDGKYLLFTSNRDGAALYMLPLTKEDFKPGEIDFKFEKPKDPVKVEIDFDGITRRIRKLTSLTPSGDLTVTPEGLIIYVAEGDICQCPYDGKDAKKITAGGGISAFRLLKDGKRGFFIKNGELWSIKLEGPNPQERIGFSVDFDRDVRSERQAAFTQFWSTYNQRFYDGNFHGRDWETVRKRYEPMLDGVETRNEFSNLLQMMVGELEASHSEVGPAPGGNPSAATPSLGFTFDYTYDGPGIRVDKVPVGAPGSFARTQIKPGEFIVAINGQDVTCDENLYKVINDKVGRELEFTVNTKPGREGSRTVKYVALGGGEWGDIHYRNRIERLREYTEKQTGGKVGYVHIAGMGGGNQVTFEREFYEFSIGKEAMVIDVRFNGGGNISDTLLSWLTQKPHAWYKPRDGLSEPAPGRGWTKPVIVMMNEHSFSNAEMFPCAMRTAGLAKLVGMPTPGYVIWTWELGLVDGSRARMPGSGVYRLDGTPLENMGEKPDYQVEMTAEDWLAERDPQLDKAIELLKK
jgi:Tol biopolymer transport system component/C-terminal processing protease CtpA/Prc